MQPQTEQSTIISRKQELAKQYDVSIYIVIIAVVVLGTLATLQLPSKDAPANEGTWLLIGILMVCCFAIILVSVIGQGRYFDRRREEVEDRKAMLRRRQEIKRRGEARRARRSQ